MAGFFDRLKTRFTEGAAGTTDLSNLTEDQQKLLRRQYMGRLGASLYKNGDFGEGMEAQAKAAQEMQSRMAVEAARQQSADIWGQGVPLNGPQQRLIRPGGVSAPQLPQTGGVPPQTGGVPPQTGGVPPQTGGVPPQAGTPAQPTQQQAAMALNDASQKRAYYESVAQRFAAVGNNDQARLALDMAKQFAAREEYFAPMAAVIDGREVLIQGSKSGGVQTLNAAPTAPDAYRANALYAQDMGGGATAYDAAARLKQLGAARTDIDVLGPDVAAAAMIDFDAKRLDKYREAANSATAALPGIQSAYNALKSADTGALQNSLVPLIRYLNPGSDLAQAQTIAAAGMTPQLLDQLAGIGGSDTVREVEMMRANQPSTANPLDTNIKLFEVIMAGIQRKITDAQNAEKLFYDQGGSLRNFVPQGTYEFDRFNNQFQQETGAPAGGGMPPYGTPEWAEWYRASQGKR